MTSPVRSREERLYTRADPEDYVCQNPRDSVQGTPTVVTPPKAFTSDADYVTLSLGAGEILGAAIVITLDRFGHLYAGAASGVSVSPSPVGASIHRGKLVDSTVPDQHEEERLRAFLEGDAVEVTTALGAAVAVVNSHGGTAVEIGIGAPQVGAQFQHKWRLLRLPVRW